MTMENAGQLLWQVQKKQGTGLCFGLDPHYEPNGVLNAEFYGQFGHDNDSGLIRHFFQKYRRVLELIDVSWTHETVNFLTGLVRYNMRLIDAAWASGIRIFKPQAAFYERLMFADQIVLSMLCRHIRQKDPAGSPCFVILDAKRGDIDSTQEPYYAAYLSDQNETVMPGVPGQLAFDAMTVTTWMGDDVLSPGLPFFKTGRGAIIVTRSSNPSGTTLQDVRVLPSNVQLSQTQEPFRIGRDTYQELFTLLGFRDPTAHEIMLRTTSDFSRNNGLDSEDGISPLFSVMGSTVKMAESFRKIRDNGAIALVPGFGHQGGAFDKIEPLLVRSGPLAGHWGILSSSRAHNFPWMKKYGGDVKPENLETHVKRSVDSFRHAEYEAYAKLGVHYPF